MKCRHNVDEHDGITCAYCHPCTRHNWPVMATCPKCSGSDEYGPSKNYTAEDIEAHGAQRWFADTHFWYDKFISVYQTLREMQKEGKL